MIIQADDGMFYKNPILSSSGWILKWLEMNREPEISIANGNKSDSKQLAGLILKGWGIIDTTIRSVKQVIGFPPLYFKERISYTFGIKILNLIPEKYIIAKEAKLDQDMLEACVDNLYSSEILIFQWRYSALEVRKIYTGVEKSFLFGGMKKKQIQWEIRKQLKVLSIDMVRFGDFLLSKPKN